MGIFKCLQRLRPLRNHRLVLFLLAAIACAAGALWKKTAAQYPHKDQILITSSSACQPLFFQQVLDSVAYADLDVRGTVWKTAALVTPSVGDLMAELLQKAPCPMLAFVRDQQGAEYLIVYGKDRQLSLSSIKSFIDEKDDKSVRVMLPNHDVYSLAEVRIWLNSD